MVGNYVRVRYEWDEFHRAVRHQNGRDSSASVALALRGRAWRKRGAAGQGPPSPGRAKPSQCYNYKSVSVSCSLHLIPGTFRCQLSLRLIPSVGTLGLFWIYLYRLKHLIEIQ